MAVKVATVGDTGVQGVSFEIVEFIDVDWAAEHGSQDAVHVARRGVGFGVEELGDLVRFQFPVASEASGYFSMLKQSFGEEFVFWEIDQAEVFDRVAKGPVADVV
jgi:hypothetical protein